MDSFVPDPNPLGIDILFSDRVNRYCKFIADIYTTLKFYQYLEIHIGINNSRNDIINRVIPYGYNVYIYCRENDVTQAKAIKCCLIIDYDIDSVTILPEKN